MASRAEITFFEIAEGELKTRNLPGQIQRPSTTDRGRETKFKVQANLHTCVHGILNNSSNPKVRASLIVLEYQLKCLEPQSSFESIHTKLTFRENSTKGTHEVPSRPHVKQTEPFSTSERWDVTTEVVASDSHLEGTAGVGFGPVTLEGTAGGGRESAHEQLHFIEGDTGRHFNKDTQVYDEAWWNIVQNQSQKHGVPRNFRVAVLLERSSDAKFEATFALEVHAGFRYAASKAWNWLRGRAQGDDPIVFDPAQPPQGDTTGVADPSNLESVDLAALCPVWGLTRTP